MPTTYAHDLFGKEVYKRLPSDMKALIRRHGDLYRIGLHGPDILFYYMVSKNPVTQFGIEMHHEKARAFFEEGMRQVRRNEDEALFAYLLGFGCHYILDSACHPSIIAYKQPVTKAEIEKIRGVKCDHAINKLVEYSLVRELGRLDAPGRPILLGTTEEFLRCFGVQDLESLPVPDPVQIEDFKAEAEEEIQLKLDV